MADRGPHKEAACTTQKKVTEQILRNWTLKCKSPFFTHFPPSLPPGARPLRAIQWGTALYRPGHLVFLMEKIATQGISSFLYLG